MWPHGLFFLLGLCAFQMEFCEDGLVLKDAFSEDHSCK